MPDAVLVLTFSPVQPFIAEARRAADLFAGSQILVALARAAGSALEGARGTRLIYPSSLGAGVPNKLVALVPWETARDAAERAEAALREKWQETAASARATLDKLAPRPDAAWEAIWERQTGRLWEVYWAAARMTGDGADAYRTAYREAGRGLDAAKRTRAFRQAEEHGRKDSLSGRREALRTAAGDARDYWRAVGQARSVTAARLRPDGRERLDAVGAVKRFSTLADQRFPSTSTVAAGDFLARARRDVAGALEAYREAVTRLLGDPRFQVSEEPDWPYDGDLFFRETLEPGRLLDSYGLASPDAACLIEARNRLARLHRQAGGAPSPYYAVVVLDGDGMGERVANCLKRAEPVKAHRELSRRLADFGGAVRSLEPAHGASVVYNGGDDVLALAPMAAALPFAQALAAAFAAHVSGDDERASASAGIAIAHHLAPLSAALAAARAAESRAKQVTDKAAVCVRVLKRSGETVEVRAPWHALAGHVFEDLVTQLQGDADGAPLATRFVSDIAASARAFASPDAAFASEIKRLLSRHRDARHLRALDPEVWADRLCAWACSLPEEYVAEQGATDGQRRPLGKRVEGLAGWVSVAGFVARRGGE